MLEVDLPRNPAHRVANEHRDLFAGKLIHGIVFAVNNLASRLQDLLGTWELAQN